MKTRATELKKGDTIRVTRNVRNYMSQGDRVIGYQDVEVCLYKVEAVYARRNRVKVAPHKDSPGIAYGGVLVLDSEYLATVEKV